MCDLQFFCAFLHIWLLPFHHNLPAQSPKAPKFGRTQKCWLAKRTPNQKQISACWPSASSNCSLPSRSREKNSPSAQSWNSFRDLQGCSERIQSQDRARDLILKLLKEGATDIALTKPYKTSDYKLQAAWSCLTSELRQIHCNLCLVWTLKQQLTAGQTQQKL